jgi:hypothetical protein
MLKLRYSQGNVDVRHITLDLIHPFGGFVVPPFPDFVALVQEASDALVYPTLWSK